MSLGHSMRGMGGERDMREGQEGGSNVLKLTVCEKSVCVISHCRSDRHADTNTRKPWSLTGL